MVVGDDRNKKMNLFANQDKITNHTNPFIHLGVALNAVSPIEVLG